MRWWHCLMLVACSSSNPPPSGGGTIGASGGTVSAEDAASVEIPAGALSADAKITIAPTTSPPPDATDEVSTVYMFGPEGTMFEVPVTVTLAYDPALLPTGDAGADVIIYTAPTGTTNFTALTTTLVDATHVSAPTSHFSIFVAAAHRKDHHDAGVPPVDAPLDASGSCTPVKSGPLQACTFTATCNGHTYTEQCGTGSCNCTVDNGMITQVSNVGTTCTGTTGEPGWSACGFP